MIINLDIELTSIPKDLIKTFTKPDGTTKKYIKLTVCDMRNPDNYGNDHTVFITQSKEQREAKAERVYVGKGKAFNFNNSPAPQSPVQGVPAMSIPPAAPANVVGSDDDLPF